MKFSPLYTLCAVLSFLLLTGCGTARLSSAEKRAEAERVAQQVSQLLDAKAYRIEVNYMTPLRGGGKMVNGSYSITVDGTVIDSHLPYIGAAYNVPYGGGKVLTFKDDIDEYADEGWKKDKRYVVLTTNNDEDTIVYTLTLFDNAQADIHVHCRNREDISYRGTLVPIGD